MEGLTVREQKILIGLAAGKTLDTIAKELFITRGYIGNLTTKLYRKMDCYNACHAVATALREGVIK